MVSDYALFMNVSDSSLWYGLEPLHWIGCGHSLLWNHITEEPESSSTLRGWRFDPIYNMVL